MRFPEGVFEAWERIKGEVFHTPLTPSAKLSRSFGTEIRFKWENKQLSGSFKFRGALNKVRTLNCEERQNGVVSASTGNHGLAVTLACQLEDIPSLLIIPQTATADKLRRLEEAGAKVFRYDGSCDQAEIYGRKLASELGRVFISPYNDPEIIYGQGTIGWEILEDWPEVEDIFVPIGGGGLISGVAGLIKSLKPSCRVFGVEPENSAFMAASLKAGEIVRIKEQETLADAVAGGIEPDSITFDLCRQYVDDIIVVSEELIRRSMDLIFLEHNRMVEGAGALALAGLINRINEIKGHRVALIVSGGNVSPELFLHLGVKI
ncbi:MAG: pyridoxal-phosphate dependent enzyme [Candidatus Aminicenantes bacterium]|nr:pyridoxal-phosphate dependent enzyme [Candidatus Aminicenantes bacterium]